MPVPVHVVNRKKLPKLFFTISENDEDVAGFSVTLCTVVLSVDDLVVAKFSVEMSDTSDISSRSRVPVEVAKSWPCSTGVDSLANLLFPLSSGPCPSRFSSMAGSGWTSTSNIAFCSSEVLIYHFLLPIHSIRLLVSFLFDY